MSIKELIEKGKSNVISHERELFVSTLLVLIAFLSFGLGRLSKIEGCREPVQIENALEKS